MSHFSTVVITRPRAGRGPVPRPADNCDPGRVEALFVYEGGMLADAADAVANAIGVSLERHDSSLCGDCVRRAP